MSNLTTTNGKADLSAKAEQALVEGDLSQMTPGERVNYYRAICESMGLNPLTRPFRYMRLNGALVLYATRDATDQLRKRDAISITLPKIQVIDGVYVVTANAKNKLGREDEATGAVNIAGLKGEAMANAMMKAETKAKRRVTLSICGLGFTDESEVDSIPGAQKVEEAAVTTPDPDALYKQRFDELTAVKDEAGFKAVTKAIGQDKGAGALTKFALDELHLLAKQDQGQAAGREDPP